MLNQKPGDAFGERLDEQSPGDEAQPDTADAGGHQDNAWTLALALPVWKLFQSLRGDMMHDQLARLDFEWFFCSHHMPPR